MEVGLCVFENFVVENARFWYMLTQYVMSAKSVSVNCLFTFYFYVLLFICDKDDINQLKIITVSYSIYFELYNKLYYNK